MYQRRRCRTEFGFSGQDVGDFYSYFSRCWLVLGSLQNARIIAPRWPIKCTELISTVDVGNKVCVKKKTKKNHHKQEKQL